LVQHIPFLSYVLNADFKLEFVNEACSNIFGYSREEAVGSPRWLPGRVHPEDRERIDNLLRSAFAMGSPVSTECRFMHGNGHGIHAILKSIPQLRHETGVAPDCLEGFVVDISDRVFLQKALIQKENLETLGAISMEVAHEIRNPLVSIGGFAQRLKNGTRL
jgi:two-component system sensor histidine kinase HydH